MKLYRDILTNCETFSDAYPITIEDDAFYVITGKIIVESNDIDDRLIGGNKSEEATEEDVESSSSTVCNIISANSLEEASPITGKASFKEYLKKYCGNVLKKLKEDEEANKDKIAKFRVNAKKFADFVKENFKDIEFFVGNGDGYEVDGVICALRKFSDPVKGEQVGDVCKMYCLMEGLLEEKC